MTNTNEMANMPAVNEDGEVLVPVSFNENIQVLEDNEEFDVIKDTDGKIRRRAKYKAYTSIVAKTHEEKVKIYNITQGKDDSVVPFRELKAGTKITIKDVIITPYEAVDEDANQMKRNVNTIIFSDDGTVYATSSKSVYFTLDGAFKIFGYPDEENYDMITVEVQKEKTQKGEQISIKLV